MISEEQIMKRFIFAVALALALVVGSQNSARANSYSYGFGINIGFTVGFSSFSSCNQGYCSPSCYSAPMSYPNPYDHFTPAYHDGYGY